MKRTVTGIAAAALALGMMAPAAFAATTAPSYTKVGTVAFALNGTTVSNPYILDSKDSGNTTAFAPVFYFDQLLGKAGITTSWDGKTWALTDSSIDASKVSVAGGVGTGNTTITLNGVVIKKINTFAAQDPAAGSKSAPTAYFPAYYVNNIFAAVGINAKWDGTTGLAVTQQAISAKQVGAQTVEVDFAAPVATGTSVTLSNGPVNYTVTPTWNSTNSSVTLDTGFVLPAGTYTVTAGSLSTKVTLVAATAKTLNVTSTSLQNIAQAPLGFELDNQFGEKMATTASQFTVNAYDTTAGVAVPAQIVSGAWTLDLSSSSIKKGDQVVVSIVDGTSAVSTSKTLTVVGASNVSSVSLTAVTPATGKDRVYTGNAGVGLTYSLKDQYGTAITLPTGTASSQATPTTPVFDGVQFISSNDNVVNPNTFVVDNSGNLTFTAGSTSGTATITAVVQATGATSSIQVSVNDAAAVKTFTVAAPNSLVVAGETVALPYTAVDQFGKQITQANFGSSNQQKVTFSSSNTQVINPSSDVTWNAANNELDLKPTGDGSATLYVYVGGVLQTSLPLTVNVAATPVKIVGLDSSVASRLVNGATVAIDASKVKVVDQYNRPYDLTATGHTSVQVDVAAKDGTADTVQLTGSSFTGATGSVTLTGTTTTTGSEVFSFSLHGIAGSEYDFTTASEKASDVTSYSLASVPLLYDGGSTAFTTLAGAGSYAATLSLTGKDSSGNVVALPSNEITTVTTSDPSVVGVDSSTGKIFATGKGSATVSVWNGATKLASTTVNTSDVTPAPAKVEFVKSGSDVTSLDYDHTTALTNITGLLKVTDQYGMDITSSTTGTWTSSDSTVISTTGSSLSYVGNGTVTIGYVTSNGQVATITVNVY